MGEPFPILDQTVLANALRRMSEVPHVHMWEILGVWSPAQPNAPVHPRVAASRASSITVVLLRCRTCNWPETSELDGIWTEEQIRKARQ